MEPVSSTSADSTSPEKRNLVYNLSSIYSFSTALVAIGQIIYASVTLYRLHGDLVTKYGYAAFGFTVLPYLIMSFVNLLGSLFTPGYLTLYLVRTEMMDASSTLPSIPLPICSSWAVSFTELSSRFNVQWYGVMQ